MDEYSGIMRLKKEDAMRVRAILDKSGSAVFTLSEDTFGALIALVCIRFETIGVMPFGGSPVGRAYVGIYRFGCGHLPLEAVDGGYIAEKLGLYTHDSEVFAEFWSLMWENK